MHVVTRHAFRVSDKRPNVSKCEVRELLEMLTLWEVYISLFQHVASAQWIPLLRTYKKKKLVQHGHFNI